MKIIFLSLSKNKKIVMDVFHVLYILIAIILGITFYFVLTGQYLRELGQLAVLSGRTAICLFSLVITPGILRRFNITWQIRNILMLFRRQIGVLTFSFAFLHASLMRLFPILTNQINIGSLFTFLFEIFGLVSLILLSFLFFTSNDWSVRKLGPWWKRIHMLIYIIAWTIALHVALLTSNMYSKLILIFAALETISLIKFYLFPKKISVTPPSSPPASPPPTPQVNF